MTLVYHFVPPAAVSKSFPCASPEVHRKFIVASGPGPNTLLDQGLEGVVAACSAGLDFTHASNCPVWRSRLISAWLN